MTPEQKQVIRNRLRFAIEIFDGWPRGAVVSIEEALKILDATSEFPCEASYKAGYEFALEMMKKPEEMTIDDAWYRIRRTDEALSEVPIVSCLEVIRREFPNGLRITTEPQEGENNE